MGDWTWRDNGVTIVWESQNMNYLLDWVEGKQVVINPQLGGELWALSDISLFIGIICINFTDPGSDRDEKEQNPLEKCAYKIELSIVIKNIISDMPQSIGSFSLLKKGKCRVRRANKLFLRVWEMYSHCFIHFLFYLLLGPTHNLHTLPPFLLLNPIYIN